MKAIRRHEGRYVLDPVRLTDILKTDEANGGRGCANGVLGPDFLIISTVPASAHDDAPREFGVAWKDIDWRNLDERAGASLRLQLDGDYVEVELWILDFEPWSQDGKPAGWEPDFDRCPIAADTLARLGDYVRTHPRIRSAYGADAPSVQITMRNEDADPIWVWRDGALDRDPDTLPQAGFAAA